MDRRARLLERWHALTQPLLLVLALLSVPLALAELRLADDLSPGDRALIAGVGVAVWAAFLLDVAVRLVLLPSPVDLLRYDKSSLLIVALGIPGLPLQGSTGAIRLARPALRLVAFGTEIVTEAQHVLTRHAVAFVLFLTLFTWWTAAALVLVFELGRNFHSLGDGLWWSAVTMATVGYGDLAPQTIGGRTVAVGTMIVGIGSFSVLTAKLFELFSRARHEQETSLAPLDRSV